MAFISVGENETIDSAIRRFKKLQEKEGILKDYRKKEYFTKPSMIEHTKIRDVVHKHARRMLKVRHKKPNYDRNDKERRD